MDAHVRCQRFHPRFSRPPSLLCRLWVRVCVLYSSRGSFVAEGAKNKWLGCWFVEGTWSHWLIRYLQRWKYRKSARQCSQIRLSETIFKIWVKAQASISLHLAHYYSFRPSVICDLCCPLWYRVKRSTTSIKPSFGNLSETGRVIT